MFGATLRAIPGTGCKKLVRRPLIRPLSYRQYKCQAPCLHWNLCNLPTCIPSPQNTFARLQKNSARASVMSLSTVLNLDSVQLQQMTDSCILVDDDDNVIGQESKKNCHYLPNNPKGYYTNSCCSHPSYSPEEMDTNNSIGIKRAAQRRTAMELGINQEELPLDCFHFLTRLHYCSASDGDWGEHEIDYVLFIKRDVEVRGNIEEVMNHCYVPRHQFQSFIDNLKKNGTPITPWFQLIIDNFLMTWWDNIDSIESIKDHKTIHRFA